MVYENVESLLSDIINHNHGFIIQHDNPKYLRLGWACIKCQKTWEISLENVRKHDNLKCTETLRFAIDTIINTILIKDTKYEKAYYDALAYVENIAKEHITSGCCRHNNTYYNYEIGGNNNVCPNFNITQSFSTANAFCLQCAMVFSVDIEEFVEKI